MYDFSQSRFDWEKLIIYFLDDVLNTQIKENTFLPYKHLFLHTRTHAVIFSLKSHHGNLMFSCTHSDFRGLKQEIKNRYFPFVTFPDFRKCVQKFAAVQGPIFEYTLIKS